MSQDLFSSFLGDAATQHGSEVEQRGSGGRNEFDQSWAIEQNPAWNPPGSDQTFGQQGDDDDFGDFEDASAAVNVDKVHPTTSASGRQPATRPVQHERAPFPPKAAASNAPSPAPPKPQEGTGKHPFAAHMDLLFDTGDDDYDAGADELGDLSTNPEAAMAYSKRIIAEQEARASSSNGFNPSRQTFPAQRSNLEATKEKVINTTKKPSPYVPRKDPNVLFDAEDVSEDEDEDDDDDDDDFGGFETGFTGAQTSTSPITAPKASTRTPVPAIDLLGLDEDVQRPAMQGVRNAVSQIQGQGAPQQQKSREEPQRPTYPESDQDVWDDFDTAAPSGAVKQFETNSTPPVSVPRKGETTRSIPSPREISPPTTVPPPAVLISLFPSIMAAADEALFNALSKMDLKQKQMLLAHPASYQFLKGYLGHCTVMAHIIAGRRSRWKRDQYLSQSMRIGPAAAGGKSGMKLAGLDKAEVAKEDREVVDFVRLWRNQVGKLRTAVTAASSAPGVPRLPAVPEVSEQMPVRSLKAGEGGITAAHACALCGLKREERVGKVDVEVEDSFGEWWVQGLSMHLSCRDFWNEFEKKLKSK